VATDPVRRSAARTATLIAVPVALAVGAISLWTFGAFRASPPAPPAPGPQATSAVAMPAPALARDVAAICRTVVAALPDVVRDARRRPVTAGAEQNAAYGDPPITVACGGPRPSISPTATVFPLSGVCWYAQVGVAGTEWTTVDRVVPVTVTVPGTAGGSAQSVIPFSAPVAAGDPRLTTVPPGCR